MKNNNRLLYFLTLLKFVLPYLLQNALYEPHRDEFLYLAEGHHMAWGFMEVPPLLSIFAWITNLFGDHLFFLKFFPSLFGALTFLMVAKLIQSLGGKSLAVWLGFFSFVFSAYLRVHYLFQPNFLEIFFWTMMACSLVRYAQTGKNRWLYLFGLGAGLGMLSKYSVAFFVVSLLLGSLLTRQRKIFTNRHFYMAVLLAFLLFLPNLIWQYLHHFPVVFHMRELRRNQLQYVSPAGFAIDQFTMFLPCCFVWVAGLLFVLFSKKATPYRFIGWAYIFVIVLLLIGQGKSYYALGAYPILFAFGSCQLEKIAPGRLRFLRYVRIGGIALLSFLFVPLMLPILPPASLAEFYHKWKLEKTGLLKWEDLKDHPLPQDFADMLGWREMAKKTAEAYQSLDSNEKKNTIVFCDNYGQAGAINYYGRGYDLPEAYSDNASFLYWMPDSLHFDNLVLVTDDQHEMEHPFIHYFASAVLKDSVTSTYARERGSLVIILKNGNAEFKKMFMEKIAKDQADVKW